jgi:CheY-like chemotaxis protein
MKAESGKRAEHTVLLVADDPRVRLLAHAALTGKGHRVVVVSDAQGAVRILKLKHLPVHSVAIRAGMSGCEEVQDWSHRRGAKPWTFHCTVNDRRVLLEGLASGADWESAAGQAS